MRKSPFSNKIRITQKFGANPQTYKQWGFQGHEGLDCTPDPVTAPWDIYAIEGGKVKWAGNRGNNYGNYVIVENEHRIWYYCHLRFVNVKNYQTISENDKIGVMGNTGQSSGAHLHLGVKSKPVQSNGYKGFVDPLIVIQKVKPMKIQSGVVVNTHKKYNASIELATVKDQRNNYSETRIKAADWFDQWVPTHELEIVEIASGLQHRINELEGEIAQRESQYNEVKQSLVKYEADSIVRDKELEKLEDEKNALTAALTLHNKELAKTRGCLDTTL